MQNYEKVLRQMEQFGIELRERKDLPLKLNTRRSVTCGKGGKDWYKLYLFRRDTDRGGGEYIVGSFGTYRHGGRSEKVQVDWQPLSDAERERRAAERRAEAERAEAARREEAALAALGAGELLARASRQGSSPYLERKLVDPEGCRFLPDGTVVLPLMRYDLPRDERLRGVQRILPGGTKLYTKGFDKPGCCTRLGVVEPDLTPLLMVCEGYATGLTARMAVRRQHPVFVALDAGNLAHVVPLLRTLYPRQRILLLADDDWQTKDQHTGQLINPGRSAARAVARQVPGCDFVTPVFDSARREMKDTDFNDLHIRQGLDAVRGQLAGVVAAMARFYG